MPFTKVNAIAEAAELQELFKDDDDTREMFHQYELAHIRNAKIEQEEIELRKSLVEFRKKLNITQMELQARTGLTQQAISRFKTGHGGNLKTILKYAEGIGYKLVLQCNRKYNRLDVNTAQHVRHNYKCRNRRHAGVRNFQHKMSAKYVAQKKQTKS